MFQDSASPLMEQMTYFHDHSLLVLIIITILISQIMISLMFNKFPHRLLMNGQTIELIWTILPAGMLILIALPSLRLLYIMDETVNPLITVKIIGHQWYWSYEYSDFKSIEFDSYMTNYSNNKMSNFRLLDVDNRLTLPYNSQIRFIVTSSDVIHSWTIPSMGIKIDGTPGRLNQCSMNSTRTGLFFGQCSEICGANHSFMPIIMENVSNNFFLKWLYSFN
uniref:Cytochrome c oxidase subunit 2 n=1 Tax=Coleoptera sp. 1 AH-2016 TaxID=1903823 RepID=A0A343C2E1_9COLE|nr:cytochrome c oxidase subunit 2 [Coleoptera sp. 1 AH-2016]